MVILKQSLISPPSASFIPTSGYSIDNTPISVVQPYEAKPITISKEEVISPPKEPTAPIPPSSTSSSNTSSQTTSTSTSTSNNTLLYILLGVGSIAAVSGGIYFYMKSGGKL